MHKRTLFLVVAVLGVISVVASGKLSLLSFFRNSVPTTSMMYDTAVSEKMMAEPSVAMDRAALPIYPGMGGDALGEPDRAIEYSANHQLVVEDVPAYMQDIRAYVQSVGGQVLYWNQGKEPLQLYRYGSMTAKVPVTSFEAALAKITAGVTDILSENQHMADITGQKVYNQEEVERIQGEISSLEAELATVSSDAARVRIQNQLTQLRRQLANAERGVEQVEERTEYATLSITVSDSERYFGGRHQPSPQEDLQEALRSVWTTVGSILRMIIWMAVYGVIWLPVVWLASIVWQRIRK